MKKVLLIFVIAALLIATGCNKKPCAGCIALEALLKDSMERTDKEIDVNNTIQDELLKANTEIVACWKIIETTKTDPNTPPKWGQGDPPLDYQSTFGNDNNARLDFMQTQAIASQAEALAELRKEIKKVSDDVFKITTWTRPDDVNKETLELNEQPPAVSK